MRRFEAKARFVSLIALSAALAVAGCPDQGGGPASPAPAPGEGAPPAPAGEGGGGGAEAAGEGAGEGAEKAPPSTTRALRVTVEATFTGLPEGARVIAPSARDRAYQKVTKSEHTGIPGAVVPAEDGENLFFVSDPVGADAGTVTYKGTFEVAVRTGTRGAPASIGDADYAGDEGKVGEVSTDAAVTAAAGKVAGEGAPAARFEALLADAVARPLGDDGSDDPAAVAGGAKASSLGLARTLAELARLKGLPAGVVQGLLLPEGAAEATSIHGWATIALPKLGAVPVDPALRRGVADGDTDMTYAGLLPPDRVTLVEGDAMVIPAEDDLPRLEARGALAAPFALKDGARVGEVTWKATAVAIEAPPEGK